MTTLRNYELQIRGKTFVERMKTPSQQLRCVFDVIAQPGGAFATADLRLYNFATSSSPRPTSPTWADMNQRDRSTAYNLPDKAGLEPKPGDSVILLAGYSSFDTSVNSSTGVVTNSVRDDMGIVFTGTISNVFRERDGANIVTRLLCRAGDNSNDVGTVTASYSSGVTLYDVLKSLAQQWGKRLFVDEERCQQIVMVSGYVTNGDITRELKTLQIAYGFQWTNYNGQLTIAFPGEKRSTAKHVVSALTGMIGIPEIAGGGMGDDSGVFVDVGVRLNPYITLSDRIDISAEYQTFNTANAFISAVEAHAAGLWNVMALRHRGDNWGNIWRTDINGQRASDSPDVQINTGGKLVWGAKIPADYRVEFLNKVRDISKRIGMDPNWLMAVMAFETGNSFLPYVKNPGSSATGLIQFTSGTAKSLGTSTVKLARMTAVEQLDWVEKYFEQYKGRIKNLGDAYMAVFAPRDGLGKPDSTVLYTAPSEEYNRNAPLDTQYKGYITRGDCLVFVNAAFKQGQQYAAG